MSTDSKRLLVKAIRAVTPSNARGFDASASAWASGLGAGVEEFEPEPMAITGPATSKAKKAAALAANALGEAVLKKRITALR